jgi:hypothetical protein
MNTGIHGETLVTNRLSYGKTCAYWKCLGVNMWALVTVMQYCFFLKKWVPEQRVIQN